MEQIQTTESGGRFEKSIKYFKHLAETFKKDDREVAQIALIIESLESGDKKEAVLFLVDRIAERLNAVKSNIENEIASTGDVPKEESSPDGIGNTGSIWSSFSNCEEIRLMNELVN